MNNAMILDSLFVAANVESFLRCSTVEIACGINSRGRDCFRTKEKPVYSKKRLFHAWNKLLE